MICLSFLDQSVAIAHENLLIRRSGGYENHQIELLRATQAYSEGIQEENASQIFCPGVVMGRQTPFRRTADVLRKTIQQLEHDPTIDTKGPAFVDLKCNLLHRILELEEGKARAESVIHLVDLQKQISPDAESESDRDSAIA